jgi:general secretion pathway protein K
VRGEGGFALIITLIVAALLVALTVEFIDQVYVDTSSRHNFVDGQQASLLADAGIKGGIKILKRTLLEQSYTSLRDRWSKPLEIEDKTGVIRVSMEEESGKLNLNQVVLPNGSNFEPYAGMAARLFKKMGISADLLEALSDWLDENEEPRSRGAESSYYANLKPPYKAKNGRLETLEELRLVRGCVGGGFEKLRPLVTVYADNPLAPANMININTAPRDLIASLDARMTDTLTERVANYRLTHPFTNPAELTKVPGMEILAVGLQGIIQVKGAVFRIRSEGKVNETSRIIEAVVRLTDSQPAFLYWREY